MCRWELTRQSPRMRAMPCSACDARQDVSKQSPPRPVGHATRRRRGSGEDHTAEKAPGSPVAEAARRAALARLIGLWPHDLEDDSSEGRYRIIVKLRRALRA